MMPMYFFVGTEITYVIKGLESSDGASYALGWFGTFVFAVWIEGLLFSRTYLLKWF